MSVERPDHPQHPHRPVPGSPKVHIEPKDYDERVFRRGYGALNRPLAGLIFLVITMTLLVLTITKDVPFIGAKVHMSAVFENSADIRNDSPVRIAGVDVGKVVGVEPEGDASRVIWEIDEEGLPVHADAEAKIRPRLFLEGNFFVELQPGSPSAEELGDDATIPITQTATAVQLDQVLTSLQQSSREDLQKLLIGLGEGLTREPTAAEDADQDPSVQGQPASKSLNDAFKFGGPASRQAAIVNQALQGTRPNDLSKLVRSGAEVFGQLASREAQLQDLVTNLRITTGALASEQSNLRASIRELGPTLVAARDSLTNLNRAFPQTRALALETIPGIQELPDTIAASPAWIGQTARLLRSTELGGTAALLNPTTKDLGAVTEASLSLTRQIDLAASCGNRVLLPTVNTVIEGPFRTGGPNYKGLLYALTGLTGESQNFDGNGPYTRFQTGGGPVLTASAELAGSTTPDERLFGNTIVDPVGTQPTMPASGLPPYQPDARCEDQTPPDVNGPAAAVGPPSPSAGNATAQLTSLRGLRGLKSRQQAKRSSRSKDNPPKKDGRR